MTAFANGFFIDPVMRQARRLSERTRERFIGGTRQPEQPRQDEDIAAELCDDNHGDEVDVTAGDGTSQSPQSWLAQQPSLASSSISMSDSGSNPDGGGDSGPGTASVDSVLPKSNPLPADDGHRRLRRRLQAIQRRLSANPEQMAQMMHKVMMEKYLRTQGKTHDEYKAQILAATTRRDSMDSPSGSFVPDLMGKSWTGSLSVSSALESLKLWPSENEAQQIPTADKDRQPTYSNIDPDAATDTLSADSPAEQRLGCKHYLRNVKLQCSSCNKWYTCRFCHDEAEQHQLIRKATRNMLCMLCGCAQRASAMCSECGEASARYYCGICKLWDDYPDRPIYHCNGCGICRKGVGLGKDFFHCKVCVCVCVCVCGVVL